eukprot:Gb_03056 [translate_table: standard]
MILMKSSFTLCSVQPVWTFWSCKGNPPVHRPPPLCKVIHIAGGRLSVIQFQKFVLSILSSLAYIDSGWPLGCLLGPRPQPRLLPLATFVSGTVLSLCSCNIACLACNDLTTALALALVLFITSSSGVLCNFNTNSLVAAVIQSSRLWYMYDLTQNGCLERVGMLLTSTLFFMLPAFHRQSTYSLFLSLRIADLCSKSFTSSIQAAQGQGRGSLYLLLELCHPHFPWTVQPVWTFWSCKGNPPVHRPPPLCKVIHIAGGRLSVIQFQKFVLSILSSLAYIDSGWPLGCLLGPRPQPRLLPLATFVSGTVLSLCSCNIACLACNDLTTALALALVLFITSSSGVLCNFNTNSLVAAVIQSSRLWYMYDLTQNGCLERVGMLLTSTLFFMLPAFHRQSTYSLFLSLRIADLCSKSFTSSIQAAQGQGRGSLYLLLELCHPHFPWTGLCLQK